MFRSKAWMIKAFFINMMSRVPFHEQMHFFGQKLLGKHKLDAPEMFRRSLELFRLLRHIGGSVRNGVVLEIGTGWFPFVPILSYLAGAKQVFTVDIHPWLRLHNTVKTIRALSDFLNSLNDKTGHNRESVIRRYRFVNTLAQKVASLDELLTPLHIEYICPYDITTCDLPDKSVDVAFSSNVLEHVPPDTLLKMHCELGRLLSDGGFALHRFNSGDHFENFTGSSINFLKFSERTWRLLGGYGLSYHNRMRSYEHAELARRAGLTLLFWADRVDEKAMLQLRKRQIKLDSRFTALTPETICASYTWFVTCAKAGRKSVESPIQAVSIADFLEKNRDV